MTGNPYIIQQGEDKWLEINVRDKSTSQIVDLQNINDLILIFTAKNLPLVKYSYIAKAGYEPLTINGSNISFKLKRASTSTFPTGYIDMNILTIEDDAINIDETISTEYDCPRYLIVETGATKSEIIT